MRNKAMSENAEGLIAVWDGQSRGTFSMVDLASKRGLRISVLRTDTNIMEEYPPTGDIAEIWDLAEEKAAIKEFDAGMLRLQAEREAGAEVLQRLLVDGNGSL